MLTPWKELKDTMANLDSILKSRDITLPTKACLIKAMVFPVVMYGCESWTIKKAERRRIDAFELWCWRRLLRVPWTARRSNQSRVLRQRVVRVYRFVCGSELTICSIWAMCVYIHTHTHTHTHTHMYLIAQPQGVFFFFVCKMDMLKYVIYRSLLFEFV